MLKYSKKLCSEGSKINQIVISILMVLPAFSYGMGVGWLSPNAPRLEREMSVSSDTIAWMASTPYTVAILAVFFFGYFVDHFGRKKAIMLASFLLVGCWALKLLSTQTWALITARALLGMGASGSYVVTPLYIKEISEDSIRGTLGSLVILSQNLGNLFVFILGEYLSYYVTLYICLAVPIAHLLLFLTMPETPSYLMKIGKTESDMFRKLRAYFFRGVSAVAAAPRLNVKYKARETLAWLRCRQSSEPAVQNELQVFAKEQEMNEKPKFGTTFKGVLSDSTTFRAFRIVMIITSVRELCGCLAVLHYASTIFERAATGWVLSANQQAILLGVVQIIGSMTASSLVEKTGRKPLLGVTAFVSGVTMSALGAWFWANKQGEAGVAWLPVASLCLCIYCDAAGLQPVPFVVLTEMFSFQNRSVVTTIVMSFSTLLVAIMLRLFHPLGVAFGIYTVFWCFAAASFLGTFYIVCFVPETRMRTVEQIYADIRGAPRPNDVEAVTTKL